MAEFWLRCTECKSEIAYGEKYYQCSVSTCNRSKLRLVFCSIVCWDSHLGDARHREAWAEEAHAPTREGWQREVAARETAAPEPPRPAPAVSSSAAPPRPMTPAVSSSAPPTRPRVAASPVQVSSPAASPGSAPVR